MCMPELPNNDAQHAGAKTDHFAAEQAVDEDVSRREVPMDDALGLEVHHALRDVVGGFEMLCFRERCRRRALFEVLLEVAVLAEIHHEKFGCAGGDRTDEADDVGVRADVGLCQRQDPGSVANTINYYVD